MRWTIVKSWDWKKYVRYFYNITMPVKYFASQEQDMIALNIYSSRRLRFKASQLTTCAFELIEGSRFCFLYQRRWLRMTYTVEKLDVSLLTTIMQLSHYNSPFRSFFAKYCRKMPRANILCFLSIYNWQQVIFSRQNRWLSSSRILPHAIWRDDWYENCNQAVQEFNKFSNPSANMQESCADSPNYTKLLKWSNGLSNK